MVGQMVGSVESSVSQSREPAHLNRATASNGQPVLRAVLASLDIQLEQEIARYRRHQLLQKRTRRGGEATPVSSSLPQSPATALPAVTPGSSLDARPKAEAPASLSAIPSSSRISPHPVPSPWDDSTWDEPETGAIAPVASPQVETQVETQSSPLPEGYLESSEHLLRSLEEDLEEGEANQHGLLTTLLTPLGMGLLLLLLLSSATLGFVLANPALFGEGWYRFWNRETPENGENLTSSVPTYPAPSASERRYPNLAANEFIDLSLDTLSIIPNRARGAIAILPSPTPTPAATPNAISPTATLPSTVSPSSATGIPSIVSTTELPGAAFSSGYSADPQPVIPEVAAAPAPVEPSYSEPSYSPPVAAAPAAPAPANSVNPSGEYYYVVTDYSGDRSLEAAQSVVGDAYVRNFPDEGAQVQMGAFSSAERAQELIQELQRQGISAELYQP